MMVLLLVWCMYGRRFGGHLSLAISRAEVLINVVPCGFSVVCCAGMISHVMVTVTVTVFHMYNNNTNNNNSHVSS